MNKDEVMAMVGKKVTLVMNGEKLKGEWSVEVVGLVTNNPKFKNHAKVLWQKPAMPAVGKYPAKPADTKPETHYVPLGSLVPSKSQLKARAEVAQSDYSSNIKDFVGKVITVKKSTKISKPKTVRVKAKAVVEQPTNKLDVINKMLDKGFSKAEIMALLK